MKTIIIDDEPNNIRNLELLLQEHCSNVQIIATAMNADEGREAILQHQPDLVFLDIQMPGKNGFELLQSLPSPGFEVIFVTGFDKYGIQAVKFSAIDYLLKPIVVAELKAAVDKAVSKTAARHRNSQLENLLLLLQQKSSRKDHKIALPSAKEIRFVSPADIIYCEAKNNYTIFYLTAGEKLVIAKPLYEYDELLEDYGFIRCHNSYLVNRYFIKSILKEDGGSLLLENDVQLPISRQKKEQIRQTLLRK
ncbi:LytR/AlgR family response regulator transcription factor [Niabella drilacis]|uniref:Two component transcriptional regulator, LytTR family n=1 Tax=Niabella drilacis (strain DSM 25811 / CCM 8410 / CCUG 62505 / LMG 26954 / E90) TaxID=1285928 RepID=A0A1G6NA13_NIADE|nr:LytTR family DNA-binding domain-containing protein [Niabella drilacis]SDC64702.1 two component transcriptional regulator, LytTR family [Niabella drilacis]